LGPATKNFANEDPEAGQTSTAQFDLNGCKEEEQDELGPRKTPL